MTDDPIATVRERSPLLRAYADRFEQSTPFAGLRIGVSAPVTPHTGAFVSTLTAGGAEVLLTGEAGSTHADVVATLQEDPQVMSLVSAGMSGAELDAARRDLLGREPDLIADDGAHLLAVVHEEFPDVAAGIRGACEQTTGGITRLRGMGAELAFPVYDVNGTPMKRRFDNVHGTAESSLTAITGLTNALLAGSVAVVVGYGHCGRGIARKLRALGARTVVTEIDPRKALEALADGHDVKPLDEAVRDVTFVVTATGRGSVVSREQFDRMADDTVIASIGSEREIDVEVLAAMAVSITEPKPGVQRYELPDGRELVLLTAGRVVNLAAPHSSGNPIEVMDTTFALMARCLREFMDGRDLPGGLHPVPDAIDREVAAEKLAALDVRIDDPPAAKSGSTR